MFSLSAFFAYLKIPCRRHYSLFILGITITLLFTHVPAANAQEYVKYCNGRFGFCVDYPDDLGIEPPPANDDGRKFYDSNGFEMTVSGVNNVLDGTLQSEMQSTTMELDKVTYQSTGSNWFVLSGYKGMEILYIKTYIGQGSINHLYIRYPANLKSEYNDIVTKISKTFKAGKLTEPH
jgi:hypothetical protein